MTLWTGGKSFIPTSGTTLDLKCMSGAVKEVDISLPRRITKTFLADHGADAENLYLTLAYPYTNVTWLKESQVTSVSNSRPTKVLCMKCMCETSSPIRFSPSCDFEYTLICCLQFYHVFKGCRVIRRIQYNIVMRFLNLVTSFEIALYS